ncbi:MAG TPA: TetR/AcrR family transcriptional regulator [Jatrophihabitans sp.]
MQRPTSPGYERSKGSPRGEARRRELLQSVTDDLAANGLVGFSLRRAAHAAGTTHKVLLYHFDSAEDLLTQAVLALRTRRIERGLDAVRSLPSSSFADRVRALWPVLTGPESWVLDQAVGLAMYDSANYALLARSASAEYLPRLVELCPPSWPDERKLEMSELVLGALRGFLLELRTSHDEAGIEAGFRALQRALDREETAAEHRLDTK